ncbi:MAG: DNA adenine methylase, partial [Deltaproteobacteria bacterium]|nr:DNA adenine methylase [Deltaproteobacteria bacterium]
MVMISPPLVGLAPAMHSMPAMADIWKNIRPAQKTTVPPTVPFLALPTPGSELGIRRFTDSCPTFPSLTPWGGSKRLLLPKLLPHLPTSLGGTVGIPFAGMLALELELYFNGTFQEGTDLLINDLNAPLMLLLWVVRDPQGLHDILTILNDRRFENTETAYYDVRETFRHRRLYEYDQYAIAAQSQPRDFAEPAAEFYYLMKFGMLGIHRVTMRCRDPQHFGHPTFSLPFGWKGYEDKIKVWDVERYNEDRFLANHAMLQGAQLFIGSYESMFDGITTGDLVDKSKNLFLWCDPPYDASELDYMSDFSAYAQWTLAQHMRHLDHQRDHLGHLRFALSNSNTPAVRALYD